MWDSRECQKNIKQRINEVKRAQQAQKIMSTNILLQDRQDSQIDFFQ